MGPINMRVEKHLTIGRFRTTFGKTGICANRRMNAADIPNSDSSPTDDLSRKNQAGQAEPRIIESPDLFQGNSVIQIRHGAEIYTLRQTRLGKLILNK